MPENSKKYKLMLSPLSVFFLTFVLTAFIWLWLCAQNSAQNFYKDTIGIDLPEQSIFLKQEDTHDNWLGDGEHYSEIQLTIEGAQEFTDKAKTSGKWSPLPLPKDINQIVYEMGTKAENIPKNLTNGIYYVRDRYAEQYPKEKNTSILSRPSYNVTVSILDFDTNILYVFTLDT